MNANLDHARVAILIPIHNEPTSVLRLSLQSCCDQNYPNYFLIVCDDSNRPEVRATALEFGCLYFAKDNNAGYKSGNLNQALSAVEDVPYIAVCDTGDVLLPDFLTTLVPILEQDQRLAFVQALTEPGDGDAIQQALGKHYVPAHSQQRQQTIGKVFGTRNQTCCGSAFLIRHTTLDTIGGQFPTKCVAEDAYISLLLFDKYWQSRRPPVVLAKVPYAPGLLNLLKQLEDRKS